MTPDDLDERLREMGYGPGSDLSNLHYATLPSLPPLDTPEGGKAVAEPAAEEPAVEESTAGPRRSGRGHAAPVEKPAATKSKKSKKEEPVDELEEEAESRE